MPLLLSRKRENYSFFNCFRFEHCQDKKFVFNHWIKPENEAGVYIKEAKKQGLKKIAMINTNQQGIIAVRDALLKEDPTIFILKDELFNPQEKDFRTAVIKAKNEGADAFLMMLLPGQLTSLG